MYIKINLLLIMSTLKNMASSLLVNTTANILTLNRTRLSSHLSPLSLVRFKIQSFPGSSSWKLCVINEQNRTYVLCGRENHKERKRKAGTNMTLFSWISSLFLLYKNYHKLISLKHHIFIILLFWSSEVLKSRCWLDYIPCGGFKKEYTRLTFLTSTIHPDSLILALFLYLQKFITLTSLLSPCISPSTLLPALCKDPYDYTGSTQIIQDSVPISRSLIPSEKCLLAYIRQHIHKFHWLDVDIFGGHIIILTHHSKFTTGKEWIRKSKRPKLLPWCDCLQMVSTLQQTRQASAGQGRLLQVSQSASYLLYFSSSHPKIVWWSTGGLWSTSCPALH